MSEAVQNGRMNRLAKESSSYLKSAAHQPVNWYPWGDEAFERAKRENKPILLDIGAVWCHWCHVMDIESYENDSTATIINDKYIAIKVDRDERPDVDARYQAAVSAISGQGGWPLTAFLTPEGRVFFGGTYLPPEDKYGRPGFRNVLQILAETFHKEPDKVLQSANKVHQAVSEYLQKNVTSVGLSDALVDTALTNISREFDIRYGGFGGSPKFPHTSAIELLLARYDHSGEKWMIDAVTSTLKAMARGGMYDQLGGGFHRYSTDEKWIVPHFEKMLYDNASLLRNYLHAYQATGEDFFKSIALDMIRYVSDVLSDKERGGFYASQDADVTLADDGSYFTWTLADARQILSDNELEVMKLHYNLYERGEMQDDPAQNVLFIDEEAKEIAKTLQLPEAGVNDLIESGKRKLQKARKQRKAPFVDRTVYAGWNGMMISSYFEAYKAFGNQQHLQFALKTLDRILREHTTTQGVICHRAVSLAEETFLDDQVEIARASIQAYEITSDSNYLSHAKSILNNTLDHFWDDTNGGFFDVPKNQRAIGALTIRNKPIQDSPTPGANAAAVLTLNQLFTLTEYQPYRDYAEKTLRHFAGAVHNYGIFAATYFLALDEFLNPPPHVVIVTEESNSQGIQLFRKALSMYRPGKLVSKFTPAAIDQIPSTVKAMAKKYFRPTAYVCTGFTCAPPVYDVPGLASTLRSFSTKEIPRPEELR